MTTVEKVGMVICAVCILILLSVVGSSTQYGSTHSGVLPSHTLTPGVTNPQVTQANIQQTICVSGWTATIRPPVSYTNILKVKQIAQYGYIDVKPADYELDHLISLELGGNPTDPKNLWPESYPTAHQKDQVENRLHKEVCNGTITLAKAQQIISTDWTQAQKSPSFGSIIPTTDPDDEQ